MATFEKESIFNLENSIEYTDGGVISKQITKNKGGNLTLFSFDKEQGLSVTDRATTRHLSVYNPGADLVSG